MRAVAVVKAGRSSRSSRFLCHAVAEVRQTQHVKVLRMRDLSNYKLASNNVRPMKLTSRPYITFIPDVQTGADVQFCLAWGINILHIQGPHDKKILPSLFRDGHVIPCKYARINTHTIECLSDVIKWKSITIQTEDDIWEIPNLPQDIIIS